MAYMRRLRGLEIWFPDTARRPALFSVTSDMYSDIIVAMMQLARVSCAEPVLELLLSAS
jgi:hypothetical protein